VTLTKMHSQKCASLRAVILLAAFACTALAVSSGTAAELSGEIAAQGRWFPQDPVRDDQHGNIGSLRLQPEFYHDWADGDQRLVVELFGRWDSGDDERTHVDIRELYWRGTYARDFDLFVGFRHVFWGVAETVHLVDFINQTDLVENIDTEQKLGQPMVSGAWLRDWGTLEAFVMPMFRERTFPGVAGRPGLPLRVDYGNADYESSAAASHVDYALRYSHYVGDFDFGLSGFVGTDRMPAFRFNQSGDALIPIYEQTNRLSIDAQWTRGTWLWKLESVVRERSDDASLGLVAGFEYTFYSIFGGVADLGVLLEYQYDDRNEIVLSDNDIAFGGRLALNDVQDTQLLAFAAIDTDNTETFASIEGSRRIGSSWGMGLEARIFSNTDPAGLLNAFRKDSYLELEITRYF